MAGKPEYEIEDLPGTSTCKVVVVPRYRIRTQIRQRDGLWCVAGGVVPLGRTPDEAASELLKQHEDLRAGAQR